MTLWQIWWLALVVKTALLPLLPITPDEAYYLAWARHPALSYLDHPPYISWIMAAGLPLWKTALTARWPGVVLSHLTVIPWFGILKRLNFSYRAQVFWLLLILLGPLTGLGSFIVTPDAPLVFFWSASLWALLWAMEQPSMSRWAVLGLLTGLGLLSKYMMILFFPAALIWILWEGKKNILRAAGPWLTLVIAFVVFSPVIIWNAQHDMASFAFQGQHGLSAGGLHPQWTLEYLGAQLGLLNPFAALVAAAVLWQGWGRQKFLTVFGLFPLAFFLLTSFKGRVEANWPVCAYPSVMALAVFIFDEKIPRPGLQKLLKTGVVVSSVFVVVIMSHVIHPWLPIPEDRDHTHIMREWLPNVPEVQNLQPLYTRSYQLAAFLSYYRPPDREVFKLKGLNREDFYDFLPESEPHQAAFLILHENDVLPPKVAELYTLANPRDISNHLIVYDLVPKNPAAP